MESNSYNTCKSRGHIRSASLENANSFIMKNTLGLPIIGPGNTGTLKSYNEQKRLRNRFGSQSNLDDYSIQSKSKFKYLRNMFETKFDYESMQQQSALHNNHHQHLHSLQNSQQYLINKMSHQPLSLQLQQPMSLQVHQTPASVLNSALRVEYNDNLNIIENPANNHNADSSNSKQDMENGDISVDQSKNLLKPIAFKPIPFEADYSIPNNRYNELHDSFGSTPSLAQIQGQNMKFGSTSDLRHGYNSYSNNLIATRRRYSRSLKINDSMESVWPTLDFEVQNNQHNILKNNLKFHQDQFDITPSPSDSGISELEAALKDRDSELSYLRQTMEHNEKVIFKVHMDKEAYWEHETKRLKAFYENQNREFLLKIKKLEQMLTLQSFQFKQNKLRLSENTNRIKEQFNDLKNENDLLKNESEGLKATGKVMRGRVSKLEEKFTVMDKLILNLKSQLEENEWALCQKNGEIALLKTQLKEATVGITMKEHEILHIKTEKQSDIQLQSDSNLNQTDNYQIEISQLNRIIILKDQVVLALTNELAKLRKELSDLAIFHEYGEEPSGKLARLKYKIDNLSGICNRKIIPNSDTSINQDECLEETDLEVIINCLNSTQIDNDNDINDVDPNFISKENTNAIYDKVYVKPNLPDITKNVPVETNLDILEQNKLLTQQLDEYKKSFANEKRQWAEEKTKVVKYQKQLQMHYINMYQKMKELEHKLSN